ncbi:hypothetical protein CBER1_00434 [Cercospora berteroae]|uniref:Uncharacterized protein n=1 Tax=Cercospora berteroae TaxID=357750 RepID=A0A2S6C1B5_9PEZI|nr:hypothetical protein CBER1_00434 [Cercospora berteroae]
MPRNVKPAGGLLPDTDAWIAFYGTARNVVHQAFYVSQPRNLASGALSGLSSHRITGEQRRDTFNGVKATPSTNIETSATIAPNDIFNGQQTNFGPSCSLPDQSDMMDEEPDFDFFCSEPWMTNDISMPSADNSQFPPAINTSTFAQKSQSSSGKVRSSASATVTSATAQGVISQLTTAQIVGVSPRATTACSVAEMSTTVPADPNNPQPHWPQWPNLMAICVMMRQLEVQKDDEATTLDNTMAITRRVAGGSEDPGRVCVDDGSLALPGCGDGDGDGIGRDRYAALGAIYARDVTSTACPASHQAHFSLRI